jgi:hypothetical protein
MKRRMRLALFAWSACAIVPLRANAQQPARPESAPARPAGPAASEFTPAGSSVQAASAGTSAPLSAAAPATRPAYRDAYALVIGSNAAGPGQGALRYAEEDSQRVAEVLSTLGGYAPDHIERMLRPSAAELRAAIERVRARVTPLARAGARTRFFFYYSGHARADALNLGSEELPLSELRARIVALPATLSILVLDACQSGAFSRVKGATRAADFSFNSVERLNTEGIAVIASSSGGELSQESEELRSGFFTHHWLVALRGAGDRDGDGRVTLSEAYQYAYNHTLATTAQTTIGEQHATLETNLRGKDDIALTQPSAANAHLRIPAAFEGRVLLQSLPSWSVFAELDKAPGETTLLSIPEGNYAASLRSDGQRLLCSLLLRDGQETALDTSRCRVVSAPETGAKGAAAAPAADSGDEGWVGELEIGGGFRHSGGAYVDRLHEFGFSEKSDGSQALRFALTVGRRVHPHLLIGLSWFNLDANSYERNVEVDQKFSWNAHALVLFLQGDLHVGQSRLLNVFGRIGGGASLAWTSFDAIAIEPPISDPQPSFQDTTVREQPVTQHFVRPCGLLSAGVQIMPSRYVGFQFEVRYVVAPAIENAFGEVHDLGGASLMLGMRVRSWE